MELKLSKSFKQRLQLRFDRIRCEVGIIENDEHREARDKTAGLARYAGGPVRKKGRSGSVTLNEVSQSVRDRLGFNYLTEPFKKPSSDIIKFSNEFLKLAFNRGLIRRAENLLQAIVRNPILRGEYGRQARSTTREKGFYRPLIDTGQLFKAIKGRVKGSKNV